MIDAPKIYILLMHKCEVRVDTTQANESPYFVDESKDHNLIIINIIERKLFGFVSKCPLKFRN